MCVRATCCVSPIVSRDSPRVCYSPVVIEGDIDMVHGVFFWMATFLAPSLAIGEMSQVTKVKQ